MRKLFERLYKKGSNSFYKEMSLALKNNKKMFIVTANPETFMKSLDDKKIEEMLLDKQTTLVPDGIGIVKAAHILKYDIKERIAGIDIANELLKQANNQKKKVYLFGSKEEVIKDMEKLIKEKYFNI